MAGPNHIRPQYESKEFAHALTVRNTEAILREQFPGRDIVQLTIDIIAGSGGGIHCTTPQQPA